jgi:hypothetical protein
VILSRRLSAFLLMLALSANHAALCASWMETRDARADVGVCPMHESDAPDQGSPETVGQSDGDLCCAASETDDRAPSSRAFALSPSLDAEPGPVRLTLPEAAARKDAWRVRHPAPDIHVPRHLLLSVLLV